jgi:DNA-binding CsgD family transcriptional regulator
LLPSYVEIMLATGAHEEACRGCEELERLSAEHDVDALVAVAAHARGTLLLAQDDARAALEPLRSAFRVWQQLGVPYLAARARVLLARACHVLGDADGAALELDAARGVFERLGAAPDLAALDAPPRGPRAAEASHGLTPREVEVLRLVASGKTNRAIARELSVSEKTIDRHVSNIFAKLDVPSRAAATAYAYEHGLIDRA